MTVVEYLRSRESPAEVDRRGILAIRPVVVDASAFLSDVFYQLNTNESQLLAAAEPGSVRLFAPTTVYYEVYRNLPKLASGKNAGRLSEAVQVWEDKYLPLVRWCRMCWETADNSIVASVSHVNDRPLAALATEIAPCHLWSDNYKHLGGVGVAPPNTAESWRSQARATATVAGATSLTVAGTIPVIATGAGIKEGVALLAKRPRLGIGIGLLALVGAGVGAYQLRRRGQEIKDWIAGPLSAAAEIVTPIVEAYKSGQDLLSLCELVAPDKPGGASAVPHTLAVSPRPLLMREIVDAVADAGLTVRQVGQSLRSSQIFERLANGRWQVGYIAAPRSETGSGALKTTAS